MPRKLRKRERRVTSRARSALKLPAVKELEQRPQRLPPSYTEAPVVKSQVTANQDGRYQYVLSDVRRSIVIAGAMFLVLIVLHFALR